MIILASGSPRRAEILRNCGINFEVIVPQTNEIMDLTITPEKACEKVAFEKALSVCEKIEEGVAVSADTIVLINGRILGKPIDEQDAFNMLKMLSGKQHNVITAVAVAVKTRNTLKTDIFSETTKVFMKTLTDYEINSYIKTGEPMDKAGSYGIQGKGSLFIEKIEGDFFNVMGLPISRLYERFKALDMIEVIF